MKIAKRFGRRYPWDRWFARRTFTLVRGRHYDCLPHGMAQMVRNAAAGPKYRLRVSVRITDDGDITVRVTGPLD